MNSDSNSAGQPEPQEEESSAAEEASFSELLEQFEREQDKPAAAAGGGLRGTVVSLREDGAFLDVGRKSEAFLPAEEGGGSEYEEEAELKVGDTLEVSITGRSPDGYLLLSRTNVRRPKNWTQLEAAFDNGLPIIGKVTEVIKGGLAVDVGVRAFLPASRSGIRDSAEFESLVGQEIRCRITQLDLEDQNVVLDRRALLEEEENRRREETLARLEPGMVVKGTVRNVRDFGAFVDLGGVDGLLHVSDLAWSRVKDVSSVLSEGDALDVKILKIEDGGKRISVGLKQLSPDPWTVIGERLKPGDRVKGTVTRLKDFGAFVELEPGVEGLVHVSEMSWARRVRHPKDLLKEGDVVEVVLLEMKPGERRISLGMKQALGDPWEKAEEELPVGKTVEGTVRNLAKFGAFVEVAEGVEGLLHISDITSERRLNHPNEVLKVGQQVKAVVLELDRENRRLKLGMKQLEADSQDEVIEELQAGDTVTGRVVKMSGREALIELGEGVRAVCRLGGPEEQEPKAEAAPAPQRPEDVSSMGEMLRAAWKGGSGAAASGPAATSKALKPGEVRSFKVTKLDAKSRTIELTLG